MIILFEDDLAPLFLPLSFTRPVGDLRMGSLKNSERWKLATAHQVAHHTRHYLQALFPPSTAEEGFYINARLLPSSELWTAIKELPSGHALVREEVLLAFHYTAEFPSPSQAIQTKDYTSPVFLIEKCTDLFSKNAEALKLDFSLLTKGKTSAEWSADNRVIGDPKLLFIEAGAKVMCSIFNTTEGPIYIGKNAEVMEGCLVRGPFSLGDDAQLKMGTKIYTATTVGPHCKVGGEVSNSILMGFSNKAHDGFLGNSVLGEWCNLGADTNTSNLKNNYSNVRLWSYSENDYIDTGLTFCGLVMGDHSKCSINTMFNTGTVVGVAANIFGGGFPPKHIPSFTWGGSEGLKEYRFQEAMQVASKVFARRSLTFDTQNSDMLSEIFAATAKDRQ